jgi:hypothetical protein
LFKSLLRRHLLARRRLDLITKVLRLYYSKAIENSAAAADPHLL